MVIYISRPDTFGVEHTRRIEGRGWVNRVMVIFFLPFTPYNLRLTVFLNSGVVGEEKQSAGGGIWGVR
jgi:hypothetical protein